jgi:hypothetical protein
MEREITLAIELYDSISMQKITRDVTFYASGSFTTNDSVPYANEFGTGFYYSKDHQFAARIGRGVKLHSTDGTIVFFKNPEQAKKSGWLQFGRKPLFTDADGVMYFFQRSCSIRNAQAEIVTWADLYIDSPVATQQQYYGSIKAGA